MPLVYFITHPDVQIDPSIPVPQWRLSERGAERMHAFAKQPWLSNVSAVFCSAECKAIEGAVILSEALACKYIELEALGENDRSATGYLPKLEFEKTAEEFFARPDFSVRGWERAVDAQCRIVSSIERILTAVSNDGDVVVISHGGVGALYLCHLRRIAISAAANQPPGNGGNFFVFDRNTRHLLLDWRSIDH